MQIQYQLVPYHLGQHHSWYVCLTRVIQHLLNIAIDATYVFIIKPLNFLILNCINTLTAFNYFEKVSAYIPVIIVLSLFSISTSYPQTVKLNKVKFTEIEGNLK